jgi:hypothetical protein
MSESQRLIWASFVMPLQDNTGEPIPEVHYAIESTLADSYGGFTVTDSFGCWRDQAGALYREPGKVYGVAIPLQSADAFLMHAVGFGHMACQHEVMTTINGIPEFHSIAEYVESAMGEPVNKLAA